MAAVSIKMEILSEAFEKGGRIPAKYTCEGENINPPLIFRDAPKEAKSLAFIMDDPDAPDGTFVHWLAWNIPPDAQAVEEGRGMQDAVEGANDNGDIGYTGPCPPSGEHHYYFRLYALDALLTLGPDGTRDELDAAIDEHLIDSAELVAIYKKEGAAEKDEDEEDEEEEDEDPEEEPVAIE